MYAVFFAEKTDYFPRVHAAFFARKTYHLWLSRHKRDLLFIHRRISCVYTRDLLGQDTQGPGPKKGILWYYDNITWCDDTIVLLNDIMILLNDDTMILLYDAMILLYDSIKWRYYYITIWLYDYDTSIILLHQNMIFQ